MIENIVNVKNEISIFANLSWILFVDTLNLAVFFPNTKKKTYHLTSEQIHNPIVKIVGIIRFFIILNKTGNKKKLRKNNLTLHLITLASIISIIILIKFNYKNV